MFGLVALLVALLPAVFTSHAAAAPWGQPFSQLSTVHITSIHVDLKVPDVPSGFSSGDTLFIWPGVQPGTALQNDDPASIGNGILTPSLTFGHSCAPGGSSERNSWWISGSYFNVPAQTQDIRYAGCHGGDVMLVEPGELISCAIINTDNSLWTQTCTRPNGQSVSYSLNMSGQKMNWASLTVHPGTAGAQNLWTFPIYVYNYRFTTSAPMSSDRCIVAASGDDYVASGSNLSADGQTCSLSAIAFWNPAASSVPVTTIPSV